MTSENGVVCARPRRTLKGYRLYRARRVVFARDGYRCLNCGWVPPHVPEGYDGRYTLTEYDPNRHWYPLEWLEVDHIQPISRGGTDEHDNLRTLCSTCNGVKGNRAP